MYQSGVDFRLHDLRRTFATHARILGMEYDLIRRSMNHKSGGQITDRYIVERIELIRPVFDKIAEGFKNYSIGDLTGRGYGKPLNALQVTGKDGGAIEHTLKARVVIVPPKEIAEVATRLMQSEHEDGAA